VSSSVYLAAGIASEGQLELYPKSWRRDGTMPGVLVAHGAGGTALECRTNSGSNLNWYKFIDALVESGYAVLSLDFGGNTWGNVTAMSRMDAAFTYLTTTMGASSAKVGIVGQSMGHLTAMNWAAQNRSKVAYVVSSMGVANLANIYGNSAYTAQINIAYSGAYSDATYGATYNPYVNTATKFSGLPWLGFAGDSDTTCPPAFTDTLASRIGSTAKVIKATGGAHNWDTTGLWDKDAMLAFVKTNT